MTVTTPSKHGLVLAGIVIGSFAGALLRAATLVATQGRWDGGVAALLAQSLLGGAALGAVLGALLRWRRVNTASALFVVALIAAIGSYGAAAALELVNREHSPWPFWRDAALNIVVTVLAARVAVILIRQRKW